MIDIESVNWYEDSVTKKYVEENAAALADPPKMSVEELGTACTYCDSVHNPYAEELCRLAGSLRKFQEANDNKEACAVLYRAARAFGFELI